MKPCFSPKVIDLECKGKCSNFYYTSASLDDVIMVVHENPLMLDLVFINCGTFT